MDVMGAGRVFVQVVELGSFSAVAKAQGLNTSSVSRQINQLERQLATRLIQRSTRQLRLTEAGELFYGRIKAILSELDDLQGQVRDLSAQPTGVLRVSATVGFGEQQLACWVGEFLQRFPFIRLELSLSDELVGLIHDNVDVAIRLTDPQDSNLVAQKLTTNHFYLCASADYLSNHDALQHPEQLSQHNCLLFQHHQPLQQWQYQLDQEQGSITVQGHFTSNSSQGLLQACVHGAGIALLTPWSAMEALVQGKLQRLLPQYQMAPAGLLNTGLYALYPHREFLPVKTKVFLDFLKEKIAQLNLP